MIYARQILVGVSKYNSCCWCCCCCYWATINMFIVVLLLLLLLLLVDSFEEIPLDPGPVEEKLLESRRIGGDEGSKVHKVQR